MFFKGVYMATDYTDVNNYVLPDAFDDLVITGSDPVNVFGNDRDNIIYGNTARNVIKSGAGNDTIYSGGGDDWMDGGTGADTYHGGSGNNGYVFDNIGDKVLDEVAGGGNDTIWASVSANLSEQGAVENLRLVGTADLRGTGNELNNLITGNSGNNVIAGGAGNDSLWGKGGANSFYFAEMGSANQDYIWDYTASDKIRLEKTAFQGLDTDNNGVIDSPAFLVTNSWNGDGATGSAPQIIYNKSTGFIIYDADGAGAGAGENIVFVGKNLDNVDASHILLGTNANQTLTGDAADNTLVGSWGNDTLNGGEGADTMVGGDGDDTYYVDNAGDVVTELAGEGTDTVHTTLFNYVLADNVENLVIDGHAAINVFGNSGNNEIWGNDARNVIKAGDGDDIIHSGGGNGNFLDGGAGKDTYYAGSGDDSYVIDNVGDKIIGEVTGGGNDTIWSSLTYDLRDQSAIENLRLTGTDNINATGNALNNFITGNGANNVIAGGAGNDTLYGKGGADVFHFAEMGAANRDTILDFDANDKIALDRNVFAGLDSDNDGNIDAGHFIVTNAWKTNGATGTGPQIIYNKGTGMVSYDDDGAGAHAGQDIAYIGKNLSFVDASHFSVDMFGTV